MSKELIQPVITADGEKILPQTRRPDGTLRKERRIRDGYTPQEEQQTYQSRGVLVRQNVPVCPGLDTEAIASAAKQAMSKSQKKNEKRKEKKLEADSVSSSSCSAASGPTASKPAPNQPPAAKPPPPAAPLAEAPPSAAPTAGPGADSGAQTADKQLRALRKKLRQAEGLAERASSGARLTTEEQDKVAKVAAWSQEVEELERKLGQI
ncbi:hypothetical protein V8C86DRAFT_2535180 [Haematococcus lacustris]